ncbi:MAG: hypothetical protein KJZ54_15280 [Phycisphaerales bacterium]|nr:hypothetical protein [Phycisphaerales bacterium]
MKIGSWRSVVVSSLAAVSVGVLGAFAPADGEARPVSAESAERYAPVIPDPDEFLARSITRIALMDLRARLEPASSDFRIASHLLGMAQEVTPDDESIVRRRLEAAWSSGDQSLFMELTRRLVELDPGDTVAQLRLISDRIKRLQTAEERVAAYERLLGERGGSLDASIRSRLALDLALLLRERGDEQGFVARLLEAVQLDPTNKDAAALAWAYFSPGLTNPVDAFELQTHLLYADPIDPNVHRTLALMLAQAGAFEQAKRFYQSAARLFTISGLGSQETVVIESVVLEMQTSGPEKVVENLNLQLAIMRDRAARELRQAQEARMPTDTLTPPEEVRLGLAMDRIRIAAARAAGDEETVRAAAGDLRRALEETASKALNPQTMPPGTDANQVRTQLMRLALQSWTLLAWAGAIDEYLLQQAEAVERTLGRSDPEATVLLAMVALHKGEIESAFEMLEALPNQNDVSVMSALAAAQEAMGWHDEASELYVRMARGAPLSLVGAWARVQARRLGAADPFETPLRAAMARAAEAVPSWIDRMSIEPRSFMSVRAEVINRDSGALERAGVRVVFQNIAPIPLGFGPDRAINSRVVFSPRIDVGTRTFFEDSGLEVIDVERRLRLRPGEALTIDLWPDPGFPGWIAEARATQTLRLNWRMLQGFLFGQGGSFEPGPLCLTALTGYQTRRPLADARLPLDDLLLLVEEAPRTRFPEMLGSVRARVLAGAATGDALSPSEMQTMAERLAERYARSGPHERRMMLAVVPNASMEPGMRAFDEAALAEEDPRTLSLALATRAIDPDHAAFDRAEASSDPREREFAALLRERLRSQGATYARCGPAGRDLAPRRIFGGPSR